jgi:hypothetical protein
VGRDRDRRNHSREGRNYRVTRYFEDRRWNPTARPNVNPDRLTKLLDIYQTKRSSDDKHPVDCHRTNRVASTLSYVFCEHLRLFSEQNAQGVQASVYNVNAKK